MNAYWKIVSKVGLPVAGLLALSACGGGGGGTSAIPTSTTVSGTAAKGLVKQANVLVCRIVNGMPEADATCASGTTGPDGSFSVTMSDGYTGPAMIKVMAGAASMMLDETTGKDISYNMTMRAMVPAVSATTTVYVTPFSNMAASAVGTSGIDASKINQAMTTVQTMMAGLGVDLSIKPMMDLKSNGSDPTMLGQQANMVKQLTRVRMVAQSGVLKDPNDAACNVTPATPSTQIACTMNVMANAMTGLATTDQTAVLAALNAQTVTTAYMPIIKADGTLAMPMQSVDMTSPTSTSTSMQAAMSSAGMTTTAAPNTVTTMMPGIR